MKFTQYFLYRRQREDRSSIKIEWIEQVIANPVKTIIQNDGRARKWGYISEEGKYLRVVVLEDGETVHSAFFDRSFRE